MHVLCREVKAVAKLYFAALDSASLRNGKSSLFMSSQPEVDYKGQEANKLYVDKIEGAFGRLDTESRRIINNDFFFNNYKYWWLELYSSSTYYRLRRNAICQFLEYLD
ncbi:MAG: hypothetical protein WC344_03375 [Bacilli bacterium]